MSGAMIDIVQTIAIVSLIVTVTLQARTIMHLSTQRRRGSTALRYSGLERASPADCAANR